jgi:hypothetical protein
MALLPSLAASLASLEIERIEPVSGSLMQLESIDTGHAMSEVGASWSPTGNYCSCCSCCLACCCCCA